MVGIGNDIFVQRGDMSNASTERVGYGKLCIHHASSAGAANDL